MPARNEWPGTFDHPGAPGVERCYGENPHQTAAFYVDAQRPAACWQLSPAAGQGAVVQQHRRRGRGPGNACALRQHRLRHRQARQPVRRGDRRRHAARLPAGLQDRPDLGLRRHHRLQPPGRRRHRRSGQRPVPWKCCWPPPTTARRWPSWRPEERTRAGSAGRPGPECLRHQARGRRLAGAEPDAYNVPRDAGKWSASASPPSRK